MFNIRTWGSAPMSYRAPKFYEVLVNSHLAPASVDTCMVVFDKMKMLAILLDLDYIPKSSDLIIDTHFFLEASYLRRLSSIKGSY